MPRSEFAVAIKKTSDKSSHKEIDSSTKTIEKEDSKRKLSYTEKKEWDSIEQELLDLDAEINRTQKEMSGNGSNFALLQELQENLSSLEKTVEEKMIRWEYLSQFENN